MVQSKKILDCLLINPPFKFERGFYYGQRTVDVPLGLIALAAYVRENDFSVELLDCNYYFQDTDKEFEDWFVENYLKKYDEIKVIGFTTTTPTINVTYRLSQVCKDLYPNSKIVLGGSHASFVPDEALSRSFVDCVVMGEGEETLVEILNEKPFEEINGLAYCKKEVLEKNEFVRNKPRTRLKALDELPMPAYDLVDMQSYRPIIGNFKRLPAMMLISSRGCPWSCSFCRRTVGKMWTYRSPKSLYDEFKYLHETHGIKDIAIMDDVFTVNKKRVLEFCELLIQNPMDVQWQCFARIDIVDEEMLDKMAEAGCWGIMYGIENFDQKILEDIQKGINIDHVFNVMKWTQKSGLESRICMIVGNEGDTEEIVDMNIDLLKKLEPDLISVAILTPFPGNDIFNKALREDKILSYDWDLYFGSTPLVKIDTLNSEDVIRLFRKMTFSFYLRPYYIIKRIRKMKSWREIKYNMVGGIGILAFFAEKIITLFSKKKIIPPEASLTRMQKMKLAYRPDEHKKQIQKLTLTATKQTAIT